ncbi:MAG: NAD-dependent epimerase/dehydratase family protein [Cellulophaga sp.]|uniref:NAD-dependent epimerase/dehydratase family protein n=1 Tax=unclassified Cellulophaga TaxID=2634405 RepID=UPI0026E22137|nr:MULTISPECIES: NAD-dependent epimerase/dehydratase family protein [unclassified Cellulophaga]MDO6489755.1 NAD-dependent epimerase/dehydratase family protein [Cellulophaga sp. 2_MG-2023]MDO6495051.1 NAD-dependent epimerase/dehydratase family protein [Cellulophaga sp. 3_MG-2023]
MEKVNKVIFFGCNGYIGSHIVSDLKSKNYFISGFDVNDNSFISDLDSYGKIDIVEIKDLKRINFDVDFIYYFSGITGTHISLENFGKFIDVNEKGLLNLLMCIKEQGVRPKIIFPSTRLVYKGVSNISLSETAEKEFKTIYALNKFHNEECLRMFGNYYNIPFVVFRIGVPYGNILSEDYSYGTLGFFLSQAKNNKPITLYGDGKLRRTFTYISDISHQIINVSELKVSNFETYNISGETYSLLEIASLISDKYEVGIKHTEWPKLALAVESGDTIFDSSKIDELVRPNQISLLKWINNL